MNYVWQHNKIKGKCFRGLTDVLKMSFYPRYKPPATKKTKKKKKISGKKLGRLVDKEIADYHQDQLYASYCAHTNRYIKEITTRFPHYQFKKVQVPVAVEVLRLNTCIDVLFWDTIANIYVIIEIKTGYEDYKHIAHGQDMLPTVANCPMNHHLLQLFLTQKMFPSASRAELWYVQEDQVERFVTFPAAFEDQWSNIQIKLAETKFETQKDRRQQKRKISYSETIAKKKKFKQDIEAACIKKLLKKNPGLII